MSMLTIHTALAGVLFWTCFCRLVRTDEGTHFPVRLAFCVLASITLMVAIVPFGLLAPLVPRCTPTVSQTLLLAAMGLVQGLTASYWRNGVPSHFQACAHERGTR